MFVFPAHLLNPETVTAGPEHRTISGGVSLSGDEDVIQSDGGGRWAVKFDGIYLDNPKSERLWSQWESYLAGGARAVLVPLVSVGTAPAPYAGSSLATPSDIVADDSAFPETVAFASPYVIASLVADAELRATQVTINVTKGSRLEGGEKFSVGGRAYLVERITARAGLQVTCNIWPPLRAALTAGAALNFDWPVVQCRAVVGQDLLAPIAWGNFGMTSLSFVEDFSNAG